MDDDDTLRQIPNDFFRTESISTPNGMKFKGVQVHQTPIWLKRVKEPWDKAYHSIFKHKLSSIPCYFYSSEIGCAAPQGFQYPKDGSISACQYYHNKEWKFWVEDMIKYPRVCNGCGKYGLKRCSKCLKTYYCSVNCQRRCWANHKLNCC